MACVYVKQSVLKLLFQQYVTKSILWIELWHKILGQASEMSWESSSIIQPESDAVIATWKTVHYLHAR
jgi:hypothetical protein